MAEGITIPPYLVIDIIEEEGSDKIQLVLKNNFTIKTKKTLFNDYEQYKAAQQKHADTRRRSRLDKKRNSSDAGGKGR